MRILQCLTTFLLMFFCLQLNAQTYFGLRAGTNFTNASKNIDVSFGSGLTTRRMIGINIGTYFEFALNKSFSLQPELNFLQKGFVREITRTHTYRFNYLELSMLLKIKQSKIILNKKKGKKMAIYGACGPYVAYAFSITSNHDKDDDPNNREEDWGLLASVGTALPITRKGSLVFDFRYIHGIGRMVNIGVGWGDLRNRGFLPSVGFAWKI